MECIVLGLFSAVGTVLFALSVKSTLKNSLFAGFLGGIGYAIYIFLSDYFSVSGAVFIATLVACLGAEIMSRPLKTPATVYSIPAIIPLVPGIMLYNTMLKFGRGDNSGGVNGAVATLIVAGSMSLAVTMATLIAKLIYKKRPIAYNSHEK